jgi:CelD/BcsL family acetyltransferase involved in cellulose biosynthesis
MNTRVCMPDGLPDRFTMKNWSALARKAQAAEADESAVLCYRGAVPAHVEAEMECLYQNIFSSLHQFMLYECVKDDTHTYIAKKNGSPTAVLLFRQEGNKVHVLNESIRLGSEAVHRFAQYVFDSMPSVSIILFHAIRIDMEQAAFPFQRFNVSEDIVLRLPPSAEEYSARLGKATRKNIKHHLSRIKRVFPSFSFEIHEGADIRESDLRDIIELNRARLAAKNKQSAICEKETLCIIERAKRYGFVTVVRIDGRVCGGAICSRVGRHYFSHVNSHDPAFDNYRLGTVCCYLTVCECAQRGGEEFHFLWGEYEYKYMLLGKKQLLDDLVIYRSPTHLMFNGGLAMKLSYMAWRRACITRLRLWSRKALQRLTAGADDQAARQKQQA